MPPKNSKIALPSTPNAFATLTNAVSEETSYEPVDLSDLTLHFKDHSFHVHAVILCKESKYFSAAVKAIKSDKTTTCSLSGACGSNRHRCLLLPDTLGGSDFKLDDMKDFLIHMYDGSLLLSSYFVDSDKKYQISFTHQPAASGYHKHNPVTVSGIYIVGNNQLDVSYSSSYSYDPHSCIRLNETCTGVTGFTVVPGQESVDEDRLSSFLEKHAQIVKLSHYFECVSMLRYEEQCCERLVREADQSDYYDSLWRLLVLSESCHWKLTSDIIKVVSKDKQFKNRDCWDAVSKSLTSGTFATLLELMVA